MIMIFHWSILILIPGVLLAAWAQMKVKSTYAEYSRIRSRSGLTGADVARLILRDSGIAVNDGRGRNSGPSCAIEPVAGEMTDHYDPGLQTLRLSQNVYYGTSVAALGIAAHEVGHAIQHARSYTPLVLRSVTYPLSHYGSQLAWPLFFIGLIMAHPTLQTAGIVLFSLAVAFTLITLPVEFNASNRALKALSSGGYLDHEELAGARRVLSAAALTYVAAAAMAILQLIRLIILRRD